MINIKKTMVPVGFRISSSDLRFRRTTTVPVSLNGIDTDGTDPEDLADPAVFGRLFYEPTGTMYPPWHRAFSDAKIVFSQIARVLSWSNLSLTQTDGKTDDLGCGLFEMKDKTYVFVYVEVTNDQNAKTVKYGRSTNLGTLLERIEAHEIGEMHALVRYGAYGGIRHLTALAMAQELEA